MRLLHWPRQLASPPSSPSVPSWEYGPPINSVIQTRKGNTMTEADQNEAAETVEEPKAEAVEDEPERFLAAPVGLAALVAFGAIMGIWAAQWAAHQLGYSN